MFVVRSHTRYKMIVRELVRVLEMFDEWEDVSVISQAMDGHFSFFEILDVDTSVSTAVPVIVIGII